MRVFHAVNNYFFDVEDEAKIDWGSVLLFYGCCVGFIVTSVVFTILTLTH